MKRVLCLILSFAMLCLLCACGGTDSADKEQPNEEESDNAVYGIPYGVPVYKTQEEYANAFLEEYAEAWGIDVDDIPMDSSAEKLDEDAIAIEEVYIQKGSDGGSYLKVKIRNNYETDDMDKYPNIINVYFQYLDAQGDRVSKNSLQYHGLEQGQGGWNETLCIIDTDAVVSIKFTNYELSYLDNAKNLFTMHKGWDFLEKISYNVADIIK